MHVFTTVLDAGINILRTILYNWQQTDIPIHIRILLAIDYESFYLFIQLVYFYYFDILISYNFTEPVSIFHLYL